MTVNPTDDFLPMWSTLLQRRRTWKNYGHQAVCHRWQNVAHEEHVLLKGSFLVEANVHLLHQIQHRNYDALIATHRTSEVDTQKEDAHQNV